MGRWTRRLRQKYGHAKEEIGSWTGDRRVEAEGAAEAASGERPSADAVKRELEATRREHHDVEPVRAPEAER